MSNYLYNYLSFPTRWHVGLEYLCGSWHWYTDPTDSNTWYNWTSPGEPSDYTRACGILWPDTDETSDDVCTTARPFVCQNLHSE